MTTDVALTENQARELTERIKTTATRLWELLAEAHEGQAWQALGYESWKAYIQAEFDMSARHSYRLLDSMRPSGVQASVITAIRDISDPRVTPDITEREARRLKPHLAEVKDHIAEDLDDRLR